MQEKLETVINPLQLPFATAIVWKRNESPDPDLRELALDDFIDRNAPSSIEDLRNRGKETEPGYYLNAVPNLNHIAERIVAPLRTARINFCLGHFEACIAMAAVACEMTAILLHEITCEIETPDAFDAEYRSFLIDRKFDTCRQGERLEMLKNLKPMPTSFIEGAHKVAHLRNKYMHVLRLNLKRSKEDALETYFHALEAMDSVIGLHPSTVPGHLHLSEGPFKSYLKLNGLVHTESLS